VAINAAELARRLDVSRYPRSARYDPVWTVENMMGPNALWLTEALTNVMPLQHGQRVMDLGCGKAMSSIFLAREFGVRVVAVDLWISAEENRDRVAAAGLTERVAAVDGDATNLGFPDGSFDAIVSIDAYHYFGTDPDALGSIARLLRPGGRLGVVVPGLRAEINAWPDHLAPWWQDGFETFHSPAWWKELWEHQGLVRVERADAIPHGAEDWLRWNDACDDWARAQGRQPYAREAEMLRADRDCLLGFARLVASSSPAAPW
jgi:cyclopropane fatty-acyl-phospholipid synthase-like methyltransferase